MKKILATILTVVLLFGCVTCAQAETNFQSTLMSEMNWTSEEWTEKDNRALTAGMFILEFLMQDSDQYEEVLNQLTVNGDGYICCYGSCVDVYLLMMDGRYRNLFFSPQTGVVTDYGIVRSAPSSTKYTYERFSMQEAADCLIEILEMAAEGND